MNTATVASRQPFPIDVEKDKTYWWCACGRSNSQPFCDGSHKTTHMLPTQFVASRDEKLWFCGCKQSAQAPFCDGTHNKLPPS